MTATDLLRTVGIDAALDAPLRASTQRFPDGAHYRVEIASVEGPSCLAAVLEEASDLEVPVTRVSQGSGVSMLCDDEVRAMVDMAASSGVELSLFARPSAGWDASATARSPIGQAFAAASRGSEQLSAGVDEIVRAAELGVRSVLIADMGLLMVFGRMRAAGLLPKDMQAKVSVMLPVSNGASARVVEELGADTINVPTDLTIPQIAGIRDNTRLPLDMYIESPDSLGGIVRHHELSRIITFGAPVYAKFGLRNAPDVYPSGSHIEATTVALARERVRRARLGLDALERQAVDLLHSKPGSEGLAIPVR